MNEKYFLVVLRWDATAHREIVDFKSKGYNTAAELLAAMSKSGWIESNLGRKMYIQKYHV